ncbi:Transcription antitermination factor NusG [Chitinophaga eiseniae]|uniref:Transcription antitermination factor NusG n=1 Tax=Chitinophaga eiseniae TaxID=634771 RepID=A0A1T4P5G0_9BACT|nr:UpxY family transcription antiterminator [Chitinophaga eiseniae]SJZ86567.1 Transcription antitermination factor NusG [Chitinophaga eiseniae]
MSPFLTAWYLLYTRPCYEKKIADKLAGMDVNYLLPVRKVLKQWHDRKKYMEEPLFPSYLFVHLSNIQQFFECLHINGVLYYVKFNKEIVRINDATIRNIRLLSEAGQDIEVTTGRFGPGERVTIVEGTLAGLSCEVVACGKQEKFLVRVNFMQRNILMSVPKNCLRSHCVHE